MKDTPTNFGMLLDVPVTLTVELGSCEMNMKDILQLNISSLIELDTMADAPVDVLINHKKIARGEIVVMEDRIGIRIIEINGARISDNARVEESEDPVELEINRGENALSEAAAAGVEGEA